MSFTLARYNPKTSDVLAFQYRYPLSLAEKNLIDNCFREELKATGFTKDYVSLITTSANLIDTATPGDWIVKKSCGFLYVFSDQEFQDFYDVKNPITLGNTPQHHIEVIINPITRCKGWLTIIKGIPTAYTEDLEFGGQIHISKISNNKWFGVALNKYGHHIVECRGFSSINATLLALNELANTPRFIDPVSNTHIIRTNPLPEQFNPTGDYDLSN
jgi:hypothetical protein